MYTRRGRPRKYLTQPSEEPTLLGNAVAAAVHGRTNDLLQLTIEYFRCDRTKVFLDLAQLLLEALGEINIQGEPTDQQNEIIDWASKELQKSYPLIDKKSENFIRYFEVHGLRHFRSRLSLQNGRLLPHPRIVHLVDVFCACVLDRCLGRKVSEMPFKICPRCRKLFLSERRQFCSKDCQWRSYWTPERRSDDKWVKDLEKFSEHCKPKYGRSIVDLQQRLALPKVIQRLDSIKKKIEKKDWAGWPTIAQRIDAVEKLAAKSGLHH